MFDFQSNSGIFDWRLKYWTSYRKVDHWITHLFAIILVYKLKPVAHGVLFIFTLYLKYSKNILYNIYLIITTPKTRRGTTRRDLMPARPMSTPSVSNPHTTSAMSFVKSGTLLGLPTLKFSPLKNFELFRVQIFYHNHYNHPATQN